MSGTELIAGLEDAVIASPHNVALRIHLIEHLIHAGRCADALNHAQDLLRTTPDNAQVWHHAAVAARLMDDPRAERFARVERALSQYDEKADPQPKARATSIDPPLPAHITLPTEAAAPAPALAEPVLREPPALPKIVSLPSVSDGAVDDLAPRQTAPEMTADAPVFSPSEFAVDPSTITRPTITLKDIIGVNEVKTRITNVLLAPMRERIVRGETGGRPGAYLMYGPPGCGKSFFASIIAGEIGAQFLPVSLIGAVDWPGDMSANLHRIFEAARYAAPCVLFIDHIDLCGQAANPEHPADRTVVSRFISEIMDTNANRGVHIIGGSSAPWNVDGQLLTDGCFDQTILVSPPDEKAREAILRYHLREAALSGIDVGWIVDRTVNFSGNDLLALAEAAQNNATNDNLDGTATIRSGHLTRAFRDVHASAASWFVQIADHASAANPNGMLDAALAYVDVHSLVVS